MRRITIFCGCLIFFVIAAPRPLSGQSETPDNASATAYSLRVAVDEVSLTFHAADAHGLAVNDLNINELGLTDNGRPPQKILAFQPLIDLPIHAGILIDTSVSMQQDLRRNQAISALYAQRLLRTRTDTAFVMDFDFMAKISQPWTSDPAALVNGVRKVSTDSQSRLGGTAIFDTVYRACRNQFGGIDPASSGNFILLFSDGEDNASHAYLKEAVDMCQRMHTAIYAFRTAPDSSFSDGPKTLAELASQTGGRVFHGDDSEAQVYEDLRTIEVDLRNQYLLVYKPASLKRDGSFHRVKLRVPARVDNLTMRTGYYAPAR